MKGARATTSTDADALRVLSLREVCKLLGVNRSTLYRWSAAGHFVRPRLLGPKLSGRRGFIAAEIAAWLAARPTAPGPARETEARP